jgi:hypothetical protein
MTAGQLLMKNQIPLLLKTKKTAKCYHNAVLKILIMFIYSCANSV